MEPLRLPRKRIFRPDEVALLAEESRPTIYRRIADGSLPAIKDRNRIRVTRGSVIELLGKLGIEIAADTLDEVTP